MTFLTVTRQQIVMQHVVQLRSKTMSPQQARSRLRRRGILEPLVFGLASSVLVLIVGSAILGGKNLSAQTRAPQATKPIQLQKSVVEPAQPSLPAPEAIAARPASPAPISHFDEPPNQARVSWDSRGLEIEASNSSLNQILHQVAADTGAKLEGLTQDQRVFGRYGPGPGSDVLLKLLDGSGYNVLLIGSRDNNAPVEIVLSARSPAGPQTVVNNQNRSQHLEPEPSPNYPPEPSRPQPVQNPFGNGDPPREPLQFMQEILQRQQLIDQQQDQQNNPHQ